MYIDNVPVALWAGKRASIVNGKVGSPADHSLAFRIGADAHDSLVSRLEICIIFALLLSSWNIIQYSTDKRLGYRHMFKSANTL